MGTQPMTKKISEEIHAKKRALERYDLNLTPELLGYFRGHIKKNKGRFIERQSRRVTIWEVDKDGVTYKVAYDSKRHTIISFLPPEA